MPTEKAMVVSRKPIFEAHVSLVDIGGSLSQGTGSGNSPGGSKDACAGQPRSAMP